jgi:hypothetical protein
MRRNRAAVTLVALVAFGLAPAGGAREQAAGCCYDAHVQGGFNRLTNLAVVGWTVPYRDLVSTSVQVGSTIAPTGFLEDGTQIATPATTGPVSIGTTVFPIDAYVYAQVRFRCVPRDPNAPDCGPIAVPTGATVASLPTEMSAPVAGAEQPPNFVLSASSDGSALAIAAGGTAATSTVWVIPEYGFYEPVDFTVAAPQGISVVLSPISSTSGTSATVSAAAGVVPGRYAITVSGNSGGLVRTQPIAVDVTAALPTTTTAETTTAPAPKPKVRLTVHRTGRGSGTVRGGGIDCGRRCTTTWPAGTAVKLAASAGRGSRFVRWSGGCSGTRARCSVVLERPLVVTAVFARR